MIIFNGFTRSLETQSNVPFPDFFELKHTIKPQSNESQNQIRKKKKRIYQLERNRCLLVVASRLALLWLQRLKKKRSKMEKTNPTLNIKISESRNTLQKISGRFWRWMDKPLILFVLNKPHELNFFPLVIIVLPLFDFPTHKQNGRAQ